MVKKLIHAVAGSGKTRTIIENLDPQKRNLLITYTDNNQRVLKDRIIAKFGYMPEHTHIFGVFEFLYNFCLIPYLGIRLSGINFDYKPLNHSDNSSIDGSLRAIHNRLSKAIIEGKIIYRRREIKFDNSYLDRIDKFFDCVYIDECQDFGSYEFNWMMSLSKLKADVVLLGDYFQKIYSTSISGNKGKKIRSDYDDWIWETSKHGFTIDKSTLSKSRRCPKYVCDFIVEQLGIDIMSEKQHNEFNSIIYVESQDDINKIMNDNSVMKLFYQKSYTYDCRGNNWGESKGDEYVKVCVVLNDNTRKLYEKNKLHELATTTKSKLYVACTRTLGELYFIPESKVKSFKK